VLNEKTFGLNIFVSSLEWDLYYYRFCLQFLRRSGQI